MSENFIYIPKKCPYCNYSGIQTQLSKTEFFHSHGNEQVEVIVSKCEVCLRATAYNVCFSTGGSYLRTELVNPISSPENMTFPKSIEDMSPSFIKTYSQASTAEEIGLSQIAGMGYRKALEYLVTDFVLTNKLVTKDESVKLPLSKLIKKLPEESIRELALASAWIGNDETHYYRQNPEFQVADIKEWIRAMINYIEMKASIKRAHNLVNKN